jgi:hypothetical protein
MKIKYRIIWFEDDKSWLKSAMPLVERNLKDKGFEPVIESQDSAKKITSQLWQKINKSDLIVMDLNLNKGLKGNKIILQIRNNSVLTEVVFYSQAGEDALRKLVHDERLDGIYCSERGDAWKRVNEVVNMNLQKAQDVNALRGLMMAEESELQDITAEILLTIHKNKHHLAKHIRNHAHTQTHDHLEQALKKIKKLDPDKDYEKLFDMPQYGGAGKQITLKSFLKKIKDTESIFDAFYKVAEKYDDDINKPRINFAHSIEKEVKGKTYLIRGKKKTEFTEVFCTEIRKNLQKHRENLQKVLDHIKTKRKAKKGLKLPHN